jgi:hypothetical protein
MLSRKASTNDALADWSFLVPPLIHPTKIIVMEAVQWIGRPLSATELAAICGGEPGVSALSYHLKDLARHGALEAVGACKARRSRSPNQETFYYFPVERHWVVQIVCRNDSSDPLTDLALAWQKRTRKRRDLPADDLRP